MPVYRTGLPLFTSKAVFFYIKKNVHQIADRSVNIRTLVVMNKHILTYKFGKCCFLLIFIINFSLILYSNSYNHINKYCYMLTSNKKKILRLQAYTPTVRNIFNFSISVSLIDTNYSNKIHSRQLFLFAILF